MPEMTEEQADRAMRILAELYADQIGMKNPKITITRKGEKKEWKSRLYLSREQVRVPSMRWLKQEYW